MGRQHVTAAVAATQRQSGQLSLAAFSKRLLGGRNACQTPDPTTQRWPLSYYAHVCQTSEAHYTWKTQASQQEVLPCRPLEEIYADFEEQPVASGSIAQIHKAKLTVAGAAGGAFEPGKVVAVKVGHCLDGLPADPAASAREATMQATTLCFKPCQL